MPEHHPDNKNETSEFITPDQSGNNEGDYDSAVTTLLDTVIASGQESEVVRQLQRDSREGVTSPGVEALQVLLAIANAYDTYGYDASKFPPHIRAYADIFRHGRYDITPQTLTESLSERGEQSFELRSVKDGIEAGVSIAALQEIASSDDAAKAAIRELFQGTWEYAREHGGRYAEVHQIGDALVPLVAIEDTSWESGSALGFVEESSQHTLAQIYSLVTLSSQPKYAEVQATLESLGLADFIRATGLGGDAAYGTLRARGRMHQLENESPTFITRAGTDQPLSKETESMIAGLAALGIRTKLQKEEVLVDVGFYDSKAIGKVRTSIDQVSLPPEARSETDIWQKVLVGLTVKEATDLREDVLGMYVEASKEVQLHWAEGESQRHFSLYEAVGVDENSLVELPLGEATLKLAGRYDEHDGVPDIMLYVECTSEELRQHISDLVTVIQQSSEQIGRHEEWSEGVTPKLQLRHREPGEQLWRPVNIRQ